MKTQGERDDEQSLLVQWLRAHPNAQPSQRETMWKALRAAMEQDLRQHQLDCERFDRECARRQGIIYEPAKKKAKRAGAR